MKFIVAILVVGVFALSLYAIIMGERDWKVYAAAHHCHPVGTKSGQIAGGISSSGKYVSTYTSDQTIYMCDAGEIQIR